MTRIAFLHTGAVVIPTFGALAAEHLPGVEIQHLLDDKIVGDIGAGADAGAIAARLSALGTAARAAGAEAVVLTCSSISGYAKHVEEIAGIPVLRIDEAMADEAVASASRISVIATLPTTLVPTGVLLRERAALAGREIELRELIVEGAFAAAVAGDRATHDRLVGDAIENEAERSEIVVLAQASMSSAAQGRDFATRVLSSPELGVHRVAELLAPGMS